MLCRPHCSKMSTIFNNTAEPESGVTILYNIVHNIVVTCFQQLIIFGSVHGMCNAQG